MWDWLGCLHVIKIPCATALEKIRPHRLYKLLLTALTLEVLIRARSGTPSRVFCTASRHKSQDFLSGPTNDWLDTTRWAKMNKRTKERLENLKKQCFELSSAKLSCMVGQSSSCAHSNLHPSCQKTPSWEVKRPKFRKKPRRQTMS